jgi:ParB/RepB/Spo0J family partition protein
MKMQNEPTNIDINLLEPHPKNPRLVYRDDVIGEISEGIKKAGSFDPAHSLIVRPLNGHFQIISGHHRKAAASICELETVPAWVREMDDETAYMELLRSNTQGELSALEKGMHALNSGMEVTAYAESVGRARGTVRDEVYAAQVAGSVSDIRHNLSKFFGHLVEIHAAPPHLWEGLVKEVVNRELTVNQTRELVADANKTTAKLNNVAETSVQPNISLSVWKGLDAEERLALLNTDRIASDATFNKQKTSEIEWAQWSWNPITGCLHDCPYCYARDIAISKRMEKLYPNGFEPTIRPQSLLAPYKTKVPENSKEDERFKNVFTCSMADLFGRWVPAEWIEAVLKTVIDNPQWNFLCLTKFPKRMAEFDIPENMWMGTTVDLQARVKNAEAAFAKIKSKVKWLSVEPMLEPLKFNQLELFDWIVIGGSSLSSQTPEWRPPYAWHVDLTKQAKDAGLSVYHKTNLLGARILEMPFGAPIVGDAMEAPEVFKYLGKNRSMPE